MAGLATCPRLQGEPQLTAVTFSVSTGAPSAFQIIEARDGQVTASFDPNFIGLPAGANDLLPGWVGDDDFPLEHLKASCLAAMERQTGLAFDRGWLDANMPTYRIPDPDEMLKDVDTARSP
jgi:hypothetical protein